MCWEAAASSASPWTKVCTRCGRSYGASSWESLEVVYNVPPAVVQHHLSVPSEWQVEVRRCSCGATLAARTARGLRHAAYEPNGEEHHEQGGEEGCAPEPAREASGTGS